MTCYKHGLPWFLRSKFCKPSENIANTLWKIKKYHKMFQKCCNIAQRNVLQYLNRPFCKLTNSTFGLCLVKIRLAFIHFNCCLVLKSQLLFEAVGDLNNKLVIIFATKWTNSIKCFLNRKDWKRLVFEEKSDLLVWRNMKNPFLYFLWTFAYLGRNGNFFELFGPDFFSRNNNMKKT